MRVIQFDLYQDVGVTSRKISQGIILNEEGKWVLHEHPYIRTVKELFPTTNVNSVFSQFSSKIDEKHNELVDGNLVSFTHNEFTLSAWYENIIEEV